MFKKLQISTSSCKLFDSPDNNVPLETEGLFGEFFYVKKTIPNWSYGFLDTDEYHGWVKSKYLESCLETNYKVIVSRTIVLSKPNIKSCSLFYLPMCSLIKVDQFFKEWIQINFIKNKILRFGYVHKSHVIKIGLNHKSWLQTAYNLINIPYKWGGRDTLSVDCSSLVQLICNTQNIFLPRNTNEQFLFLKSNYKHLMMDIKDYKNLLQKGCLIYWEGHVAIVIDKNTLIHASAFHNNVTLEKIEVTLNRFMDQKLEIKLICHLLN